MILNSNSNNNNSCSLEQQLVVQTAHQRYSSMESGFEADTEQDTTTPPAAAAWYLTSSCSPFHPPTSVTSLTDKSSEPSTVCLSPQRPQTPPPIVSPDNRHYSPDHTQLLCPHQPNIPSLNLESAHPPHSNHAPLPPPIVVSLSVPHPSLKLPTDTCD